MYTAAYHVQSTFEVLMTELSNLPEGKEHDKIEIVLLYLDRKINSDVDRTGKRDKIEIVLFYFDRKINSDGTGKGNFTNPLLLVQSQIKVGRKLFCYFNRKEGEENLNSVKSKK